MDFRRSASDTHSARAIGRALASSTADSLIRLPLDELNTELTLEASMVYQSEVTGGWCLETTGRPGESGYGPGCDWTGSRDRTGKIIIICSNVMKYCRGGR